jgi:hypothetical protein
MRRKTLPHFTANTITLDAEIPPEKPLKLASLPSNMERLQLLSQADVELQPLFYTL